MVIYLGIRASILFMSVVNFRQLCMSDLDKAIRMQENHENTLTYIEGGGTAQSHCHCAGQESRSSICEVGLQRPEQRSMRSIGDPHDPHTEQVLQRWVQI